ncbi:MAG TPA: phenylalanine--tRNA ligase subunit beta [Thermodesulfobacteriota bacterium]|jgi:phenylalanyl-tRNA synthetase beta chain|nr:phenylalanine--tRNA ligase subunit beta [Thermodesulfobacteriota bacterium]
MKVSLNWLKDYVEIRMELKDLIHLLTMAGLEVEGAVSTGEGLEKVVVAEIQSVRRHPNADRLSLVEAKTDRETFSIVCGATNIKEGQKVPLALVGARLPNGTEIKRSKIRGVTSDGMLCSETELVLGRDASGIMILPASVPLGVELGEALGLKDTVLDISITPNRPDCLCVIGVAREIAALTRQKMKYPLLSFTDGGEEIHQKTSVTILDQDLCPRYVARMIEGVKIGPSPSWVSSRLEKVGIRSISNVVDVTNYVMMEYGQPLHAFDFAFLEEGRIVVRRAKDGEEFVTLDGVKRILEGEMLMICDGVKPVAIAGVMGGLNSEIKDDTTDVLLESAYFDPAGNRRTSKKLGLETEAAYRFGRGIDYGGCVAAANRAAQLIQEWAGGRVVEGVVDAYPAPIRPKPIRLRTKRIHQILGTEVPTKEAWSYLENLELEVWEEKEDVLVVVPATFRGDLEREIDLIEEVARLNGYDRIPITLPTGPPSSEKRSKEFLVERKTVNLLNFHGYNEVINYSFTSPAFADRIRLPPDDPRRQTLRILNPLAEDLSVMRTTLIPGLMETVQFNLFRKNSNLKLFELKKVFLPQEGERLPREVKFLAGVALGFDRGPHWTSPRRPVDFYDIKGCVEDLLDNLQIKGATFSKVDDVPYLHPGKASKVVLDHEVLGVLGEAHPQVVGHYEVQGPVYLFEIDFSIMVKWAGEGRRFQPLPRFPAVYRDLSVVVDKDLEVSRVVETIRTFDQPFVEEVTVFDIYQGPPIPGGKKGVSYRIRYQANDRTLTDEEVNRYHENLLSRLREVFQLDLRQ